MATFLKRVFRWGVLALLCGCGAAWAQDAVISVDVGDGGHTVSPLLFGDQIQWSNYGQDLLSVPSATPSTATLRTDVLTQFKTSGVTLMRYPGGTLSDFFHWYVSTGAFSARQAQLTVDLQAGSTYQYQTQVPYFGADEFRQAAAVMGTEMLITANVGTGTAAEAAHWLSYYKSQGATPKYWEIGNEVYLPGTGGPAGISIIDDVHMTAAQYAAAFDAYAAALRAVDPSVQVGAIGVHVNAPGLTDWNQNVLSAVHQKIDFLAIHNAYAPQDNSNSTAEALYRATVAAPVGVRANFDLVEQDVAAYAQPASRNLVLAVTEYAALFTPPLGSADAHEIIAGLNRSQSLAGALYTAGLFHLFFRDSAIQMATHINPVSWLFQGLYNVRTPNLPWVPTYDAGQPAYPVDYTLNPIETAHGKVFRLYADAANGAVCSTQVSGSPTFNTDAVGNQPAETNVPALDAVAVLKPGTPATLYIYVINRDLDHDVDAQLQLKNVDTAYQTVRAERVNGSDYKTFNTQSAPNAVTRDGVPVGSESGVYTFPAHSLTRFTLEQGAAVSLNAVHVFPNPLRPAKGQTGMNFTQLPPGARVQLYTLSGEKVKSLTADGFGAAVWDGTNEAGQKAASGVYFAHIDGNGDQKTLKIAIQR